MTSLFKTYLKYPRGNPIHPQTPNKKSLRLQPNKQLNCPKPPRQIYHAASTNFQFYSLFILLPNSLAWYYSNIILIPKPDKLPDIPSSFRPISILPTLTKIFLKILFKMLLPLSDKSNIIPNHQFGFRSKHYTIHQLKLTNCRLNPYLYGIKTTALLLDVAQAFDRV